ncbi:MAG: tetratricopeptide repeat protein [Saprospiraceae bacterium]|nr:tetratricopeptide repeat protein [Saprospiraceae bacterium]HMW38755.1 tetratricopeptide repeat protein [Saprospiraceae bacterium]HMX89034.1 tetratricopeptide repeat protein [Saprospiraceae bacterium]HMZ40930.1 tetratricopeptide repeat protein [Saprospiraceae bacterium]HNB30678.1 tetratricopeptide repeat protein [Saprospiraceae bacterium]
MINSVKYFAIGFLILLQAVLFAQQKGATVITNSSNAATGKSYAVVVGISNYQDPAIPDLQYADKDAEAFVSFLRSDAGGKLDGDHLKVLINEKATMAQFAIALDWLMEVARENDQVFIYFSGHGDVEKKTITQPGYLLCWDAPKQVYLAGGAMALPMFQDVVTTMSTLNKAKVIIIADACRSGKLSGNAVGGSQITGSNLAKQYANEIKILSCQPNEYSVEGPQWGGGRGAFSYHLLDGLYGMADYNADQSVSVKEIHRYLEDKVSNEVAPQSQNPMVTGSLTEKLTDVFPELLSALKEGRKNNMQLFTAAESRGIEEDVLGSADTNTIEIYEAFKKALKKKQFLFADQGQDQNDFADYYYKKLVAEPQLARLHSAMRRNYAAALQDDAQQVINEWMRSSGDVSMHADEVGKNRKLPMKVFNEKLRSFPQCLERAAELLGSGHYMFATLKARSHFFEGYLLANANRNPNHELGEKALKEFRMALQWQSNLPLTYWQMCLVFGYNLLSADSAEAYAKKVMELQPTWVIPYVETALLFLEKYKLPDKAREYLEAGIQIDSTSKFCWNGMAIYHYFKKDYVNAEKYYLKAVGLDTTNGVFYSNLGLLYKDMQRFPDAEKYFLKALFLDSTDASLYSNLGILYHDMHRYDDAEKYYLKGISLDPTYARLYNNLGIHYMNINRYDQVERYLRKAIDLDSTYSTAFQNLGIYYLNTSRYEEAYKNLREAHVLDSTDALIYFNLGTLCLSTDRYADAEKYFLKGINLDSTSTTALNNLAAVYHLLNRYPEAEKYLIKAIQLNPAFALSYYNLAGVLSLQHKIEEAYGQLELAIQKGFSDYSYMREDADLHNLRLEKVRWDSLMEKYFPKVQEH